MVHSDVVVLVVDAEAMKSHKSLLTERELGMCIEVMDKGKALVVVLNKLDVFNAKAGQTLVEAVADQVRSFGRGLPGVQVVATSAKEGAGVEALMPVVWDSYLK